MNVGQGCSLRSGKNLSQVKNTTTSDEFDNDSGDEADHSCATVETFCEHGESYGGSVVVVGEGHGGSDCGWTGGGVWTGCAWKVGWRSSGGEG